ncbi:MAG TPA: radical SAM protein [Planctomycetota bacterium]|nr:radical SAM protein [Planctomycetota bacterium]
MVPRYGLVLTVTHACNLRCDYCYTGTKRACSMAEAVGRKAIERAVASVERGGALELGFFGGEPLLEAGLVRSLLAFAQERSRAAGLELLPSLTTNGTVATGAAWELMTRPELSLAVSFDGVPEAHDRHRRFPDGTGSSSVVLRTMRRLLDAGRELRAVLVVRPDTLDSFPDGVGFLSDLGFRQLEPTLDLWTRWTAGDVARLEAAIGRLADLWRGRLADLSVSWLDEKAALLARVPIGPCARCGFGEGEVAVAPSGRLYPCERLIGDDAEMNPMRLPGHALDGEDFLGLSAPPACCAPACGECDARALCNTTCRCSNYVRTGQCGLPDGLLCALNRACLRETARVLNDLRTPQLADAPVPSALG